MVDRSILDEYRNHINHRIITKRNIVKLLFAKKRIRTESSLILQTIHRLQSMHCQLIVRIFSINFSEYFKHDGCPRTNKILLEKWYEGDSIPEFPHSAQCIISSGTPFAFFSLSPKQNPQIPIGLTIFYY